MEMEDQYGMADLRQLMNGRPHFPSIPTPPPPTAELFSAHHRNLSAPPPPPQPQHYEMLMMGSRTPSLHHHHHHHEHQFSSSDYATAAAVTGTSTAALSGGGLEVDLGCLGGDGGTGRWPRQETLTLLEIRSRLDPKFKEANQKGPLWDEVSRIMSEEHGYQRSGKKCREKFENLYKYYKKTKEGKAGRQDGKHYRFFRQLEALYGSASTETAAATTAETPQYIHAMSTAVAVETNNQDAFQASLSLSASSEFDSSSSDGYNNDDSTAAAAAEKGKKRRSSGSGGGGGGRRSWKAKVSEFIDAQMRRLMEKQEAWLEKMLRTLEDKEQERMLRDDDWRRQEVARLDREHRFWANERAWIKARDAALLEALQKLAGGCKPQSSPPEELMVAAPEIQNDAEAQTENGNENGGSGGGDGWGERENYSMRSGCYFPMSLGDGSSVHRPNDRSSPPPNSNNGVVVQDGCFRFLMADGGENVWENYGLKLKGENN